MNCQYKGHVNKLLHTKCSADNLPMHILLPPTKVRYSDLSLRSTLHTKFPNTAGWESISNKCSISPQISSALRYRSLPLGWQGEDVPISAVSYMAEKDSRGSTSISRHWQLEDLHKASEGSWSPHISTCSENAVLQPHIHSYLHLLDTYSSWEGAGIC